MALGFLDLIDPKRSMHTRLSKRQAKRIQSHARPTISKRFHSSKRLASKVNKLGASDSPVEEENTGGENNDDTGAG